MSGSKEVNVVLLEIRITNTSYAGYVSVDYLLIYQSLDFRFVETQ